MIPWVHYVVCPPSPQIKADNQPIQLDYSDLYNVISFFSGPPGSPGAGNDDLAREISESARKFGEEHWRWVDMQGYMFRLLLEYVSPFPFARFFSCLGSLAEIPRGCGGSSVLE